MKKFIPDDVILNKIYKKLIVFGLGVCYVFSFPPFNLWFLGIISILLTSLIFSKSTNYKDLFLQTFIFASAICLFGFYWIFYAISYILSGIYLSGLTFLGFILLITITIIPTSLIIYKFGKIDNKYFFVVWFIAWLVYELVKQFFMGGFPWYIPALWWSSNKYAMQIADIIGSNGLSIFTLFLIFSFLLTFSRNFSKKFKTINMVFIVFFLLLINFYGYKKIKNINLIVKDEIQIRIVQPNIQQYIKLNPYYFHNTVSITNSMAFNNLDYSLDYIILPEVAYNNILSYYPSLIKELQNNIKDTDIRLLLGYLRKDNNNNIYNSFQALGANTYEEQVYDKVKLVPFGEYIPIFNKMPNLSKKLGLESFSSGSSLQNRIISLPNRNDKFLILICFEGIFSTKINKNDVDWILNISNEAWFNESIAQEQMLALLRFRAIEAQVPVVKVSNTGISAVISPLGDYEMKLLAYNSTSINYSLHIYK